MEISHQIAALSQAAWEGRIAEYQTARAEIHRFAQHEEGRVWIEEWISRAHNEALRLYQEGLPEDALAFWVNIEAVQQIVPTDPVAFALTCRCLSATCRDLNASDLAENFLLQALEIASQNEGFPRAHLCETYGQLGALTADHGAHEAAIQWSERARALLDPATDSPEELTTIYTNLGISHQGLGHYDQAIAWYRAAYDMQLRRGNSREKRLLAAHALGQGQRLLGDFQGAEATIESELVRDVAPSEDGIAPSRRERALELQLQFEQAHVFQNRQQFHRAEPIMEAVTREWKQQGFERDTFAVLLGNYATVLLEQGKHVVAEPILEEALQILRSTNPGTLSEASTLSYLAVCAGTGEVLTDENYTKARRFIRESLTIQRQHAPGSLAEARSLGFLGVLERRRGNFKRAEILARRELAVNARALPLSVGLLITYRNLLLIFDQSDNYDGLTATLQQARRDVSRILAATTDESDRIRVVEFSYDFVRLEVHSKIEQDAVPGAFAALDRGRGQNIRYELSLLREHPDLRLIIGRIRETSRRWSQATPEERPMLAQLMDQLTRSLTSRLELQEIATIERS